MLREGASAFAFALPHPALGTSPISGQGRGRRRADAGRTHGQGRGWPCALPPLRTVIRHTSGQGLGRRQVAAGRAHDASPISGQGRGRRQAAAGRTHGQGWGLPGALPPLRTVIRHTSGMVRHCTRGRPPLPSPSPPCARRRGTRWHNGANTPGERREGERYIIYTRAQARGRERFAQGGEQQCG